MHLFTSGSKGTFQKLPGGGRGGGLLSRRGSLIMSTFSNFHLNFLISKEIASLRGSELVKVGGKVRKCKSNLDFSYSRNILKKDLDHSYST